MMQKIQKMLYLELFFQRRIVEEFLDEVHMAQQHSTAAIPANHSIF
jgi:hypothetical protein